jgi:hypothetical protein
MDRRPEWQDASTGVRPLIERATMRSEPRVFDLLRRDRRSGRAVAAHRGIRSILVLAAGVAVVAGSLLILDPASRRSVDPRAPTATDHSLGVVSGPAAIRSNDEPAPSVRAPSAPTSSPPVSRFEPAVAQTKTQHANGAAATDQVVIAFAKPLTSAEAASRARLDSLSAAAGSNVQFVRSLNPLHAVYKLTHRLGSGAESTLAAMGRVADVAGAEPDLLLSISILLDPTPPHRLPSLDGTTLPPNDPAFGQVWGLQNTGQTGGTAGADIHAAGAWAVRTDADTVTVAVIDTGMQLDHVDLAANLWTNPGEIPGNGSDDDHNGYVDDVHGWDFVNNDAVADDDNGHGTHVAGTIGAVGNNGIGIAGIAWSVRLMPLKAFGASGAGYVSAVIGALDYAVANGAKVVNESFGGDEFTRSEYDAFVASGDAGVVSIAAAGNRGANADETPHYPASFRLDTIVAVAATTSTDTLASFSNYGILNAQVGAPGQLIYSTIRGNAYGLMSGTSMATPHVAGVAALLAAEHPTWNAKDIRDRILGTTRPVAALAGKTWTGGVVDAAAALSSALTVLPPDPPAPTPQSLATTIDTNPVPAPATAPTPPSFVPPDVIESDPVDAGAPEIALDASGKPSIAYARRYQGVHLLDLQGAVWQDRQLTSSYDDFSWLDFAIDAGGVPTVAVQRFWSSLDAYWDPGVIIVRGTAVPTETRLTAACPAGGGCFSDWTPSMAFGGTGDAHVVFTRSLAAAGGLGDRVVAPGAALPAPGAGAYYATNAGGDWVVRQLTTGAADGPAAIAVAADGTVHIVLSRRSGSTSGLTYLTNAGGTWTSLRLSSFVEDLWPTIGVDALGGVHITFARPGMGLYYLHRSPVGDWSTPALVYDGNVNESEMALDGSGFVHVAFGVVDGTNSGAGIRYATNATGSWASLPVAGGQGHAPSLAIDLAGHAHIAYLQAVGAPLGVHYSTNATGSFVDSLVQADSSEGGAGAIAYVTDTAGHHHVAMASGYGEVAAGLYYGTDASDSWVFTRVGDGWPSSVAMTLDPSGHAHIAFAETIDAQANVALPYTEQMIGYATNTTGDWRVERVSPMGYVSSEGVAIVIDGANEPQIVFADSDGAELLRARRAGGAWPIETIYAAASLRQPSMTMDASGILHVAVVALLPGDTGGRIVYVSGTTANWSSSNATAGDVWHMYPSLGRAVDGTIWIAEWPIGHGVEVVSRPPAGAWETTALSTNPTDAFPSLAIDVSGVVHVVYSRGSYYGYSGCVVPECASGPGLRHAALVGSTWQTTRLTPYWHDAISVLTSGGDGSLGVAFERLDMGLRSLELIHGKPGATLTAPASRTNAATLSYGVAFSRDVTGLSASDLSVSGTSTGCVVEAPSGSGATYDVEISGCSEGTVTLALTADAAVDGEGFTGPVSSVAAPEVTVDRVPPSVVLTAASPAADATYVVTFSEPVTGLAVGDFGLAGTAVGCTVADPTGSGAGYSIAVTGCSDGTVTLSLSMGSVTDAAGNPGPVADAIGNPVTIDGTSPDVTTPAFSPSTIVGGGSTTVSATATDPSGAASAEYSLAGAAWVSMSASEMPFGGTSEDLTATFTAVDASNDALAPGLYEVCIRVTDVVGNTSDGLACGTFAVIVIDTTAPTATFTNPTSPTKSAVLSYSLTFDESVTGLAAGDFGITGTATGCSAGAPSGSDAVYAVVIAGCSEGTVSLSLAAGSVTDLGGNSGPSSVSTAAAVSIDRTAPTATLSAPVSPTSAASISYALAFSEPVNGLAAADLGVSGTATGCLVGAPSGSAGIYTVAVGGCSNGTIALSLAAGSVSDVAGNTGPAAPISASTVTIMRTAPTATLTAPASPTAASTLPFFVAFSRPISGLSSSDFTVTGTATGCLVGSPGPAAGSYSIVLSGCGEGTVRLVLAAAAVSDAAGNRGPAAAVAATTVTVDRSAPTAVLACLPAAGFTNVAILSCSATFTEPPGGVSAFTAGDVLVGGTATGWTARTPTGSGTGPYAFTVVGAGAGGTLTVAIAAAAVTDGAGNPTTASKTLALVIDRALPTATVPAASPRVGMALTGTLIPLNLVWTGADGTGSGVARYELARSTNGGMAWTTVSSSLASATADVTVASSGTVMFRVRAVDRAGNLGSWATGLNLTPRLLQQTSTSVRYGGTWRTTTSTSYSGGSAKYASAAGASATYTFTGRSIALVTTVASSRGQVKIYVNGVFLAKVDLRGATKYRDVAWQKTWSTSATRTIKLVVVGTAGRPRIDLDGFVTLR